MGDIGAAGGALVSLIAAQAEQDAHDVIAEVVRDRIPGSMAIYMRSDGEAAYSLADNGPGFDERHAGKLCQVFERLHGSEYEGSGFGLAIVRRAVEAHGGRVWAESAPDEGATFFFSLPAAGLPEARPAS